MQDDTCHWAGQSLMETQLVHGTPLERFAGLTASQSYPSWGRRGESLFCQLRLPPVFYWSKLALPYTCDLAHPAPAGSCWLRWRPALAPTHGRLSNFWLDARHSEFYPVGCWMFLCLSLSWTLRIGIEQKKCPHLCWSFVLVWGRRWVNRKRKSHLLLLCCYVHIFMNNYPKQLSFLVVA